MFAVFILFAALGSVLAGYAGSSTNNVGAGNSYGYGYSGSFSGGPGDNIPALPIPNFPNFDFGNLNGYFDSFKKYQEHFINTLQEQAQQQAQLAAQNPAYAPSYTSYQPPINAGGTNSYSGGTGGSFPGADGSAVAGASIGPQGGYQTAAVYPENPNSPNIFSRFAETAPGGGGGGGGGQGSYGVFTSSVSSSSNVDGKPQNFHQASTTINDNGKISTYTVKNP